MMTPQMHTPGYKKNFDLYHTKVWFNDGDPTCECFILNLAARNWWRRATFPGWSQPREKVWK